MTKIWYNITTGSGAVFDDNEDMSNWPDYQETKPAVFVEDDMRNRRNVLLAHTDKWALSDRTMTQDQINYRQGLRDITSHADWPNLSDSEWPVEPTP